MNKPFRLIDQNDRVEIVTTHYYKWLKENVKNVHYIETKLNYLKSQGFNKGTDFLTREEVSRLQSIERYYGDELNKLTN